MEKKSSALGFVWFLNLCLQSFPQNSTLFLEKWSSDELEWVRRICDCKRMLRRPIQNRKDKASGAWFLMSGSRTSADTERRDWNQQSCSSHCGICSISPPTIVLALAVLWMQFDARSPWAVFLRTERKHRNLNHMTNSLKFLINVHSGYSHMIQSPLSALSVQRRNQYSENPTGFMRLREGLRLMYPAICFNVM